MGGKRCKSCRQPLRKQAAGRPHLFCSRACRQKEYRKRVAKNPHAPVLRLLQNDLYAIRDRTARKNGAVKVLEELGYLVTLERRSSAAKPRSKTPLTLVSTPTD
jgi:hypothetical protein